MSTMRLKNKDGTWDKVPVLGSYQAVLATNEAATNAQNAAISVQKYKALWFNSVAAMKAEPSLTAGAYVNTAGYYSPNDGGGASYLIREKQENDTADGGSLHELSNGLVAELIVENGTVCPEQFGAKGDGVTDDTEALQNAFKRAGENSATIVGDNNYRVTNTVVADGYIGAINFNGVITATFKDKRIILVDSLRGIKIRLKVSGDTFNGGYAYADDGKNDLTLIGICARNLKECDCSFYAYNCHIGVQILGDGKGNGYNTYNVRVVKDNVVNLELNAINKGWVNENLFLSGNFTSSAPNNIDYQKNIGIRIWSADETYTNNNNNIFIKPTFEYTGLPVYIKQGSYNRFLYCRCENDTTPYIRVDKGGYNSFVAGSHYGASGDLIYRNNQVAKNYAEEASYDNLKSSRLLLNYQYEKDDVLVVNNGNYNNIYHKFLDFINVSTGEYTLINKDFNVIAEDVFNIPSNIMCGIWVDIENNKDFLLYVGCKSKIVDLRYSVILYDADFQVITPNTSMLSQTNHYNFIVNGVALKSSASVNNKEVGISILDDSAKYAFIGVNGINSDYALQTFQLYACKKAMIIQSLPHIFKRQPVPDAAIVNSSERIIANLYIGKYIRSNYMYLNTSSNGSFYVKGYLCTAISEDGTPTWVNDKIYV